MRRGYTREAYIDLLKQVREILPNVAISSDFICGFCGETDEDFKQTISLINEIKYNVAYLFQYSMREKTTAHRRFIDDISSEVKYERLMRMTKAFRDNAKVLHEQLIGTKQLILIENVSKRSTEEIYGRCDGNVKVIIPNSEKLSIGDYVAVEVIAANSQVLKGKFLEKISLSDFHRQI